ncbi:MAG: ATP-grasp domain-containing protein [Candidatus Erginobacter occultus]|nr:ATP-grasp domain-containing protein [Candidatus Erginobacter occultus]
MKTDPVLVVGTTADYIDHIGRNFPGRALFLTDPAERSRAGKYPDPGRDSEVLSPLVFPAARAALRRRLEDRGRRLSGVACFDCESLSLAAELARDLALPFVSPEAVRAARDKYLSKRLWERSDLPCPGARLVREPEEAVEFIRGGERPAVLKPLTGSGSELIFLCRKESDCRRGFSLLREKLAGHPNRRMYGPGAGIDPRTVFVIEELVEGEEWSCDFTLDPREGAEIVRLTRKVPAREHSFGTVLAYRLSPALPAGIAPDSFRRQLERAARALGIERSICMLDFIVAGGSAKMIELTPRPGGDCLVALERLGGGFDMPGYALDFAAGREVPPPSFPDWEPLAGLHLLSPRGGSVRRIDPSALLADPRVRECRLTARAGDRVTMPPDDYESRRLGHLVFEPRTGDLERECRELSGKLELEFEDCR